MSPRNFLLTAAVVALTALAAGCVGMESAGDVNGRVAAAPTFHVGERWVYRAREGFRLPTVWEETHEVTAAGPEGIVVRVTVKGPTIDGVRYESLSAPGVVRQGTLMDLETRRFATPLERYRFPLASGETWNQWVNNFNEMTKKEGQINRYVRVGGWEKVSTPAGEFDAIRMRVIMRLDDEEFWRYPTTCNYLIWYAPAVGGTVREEKEAQYFEKGDERDGNGPIRSQHTLIELVAYTK